MYSDIDRFEAHLSELSPQDADAAKGMCRLMRKLGEFPMPVGKAPELAGTWDNLRAMVKMAPYLRSFAKAGNLTRGELAPRFKDPSIRKAIAGYPEEAADSAIGFLMVPGMIQDSGYVMGGLLEFARSFEKRLLGLGGAISYHSRVAEIVERDGRAVGVRLDSGQEIAADYVISACDMRSTLFSMLDGKHIDPVHQKLMDTGRLFDPFVQVAFGVDMDFSNEIRCSEIRYELETPVEVAGRLRTHIPIRNQCHDPSTAPPGKSVVLSMLPTDWSYWEPFASDRDAYRAEKDRVAAFCKKEIDAIYPRLRLEDRDDRRGHAAHVGAVHGQLAGRLHDVDPGCRLHAQRAVRSEVGPRPGGLLHGQHVDEPAGRAAGSGFGGSGGRPTAVPRGWPALRDVHAVTRLPGPGSARGSARAPVDAALCVTSARRGYAGSSSLICLQMIVAARGGDRRESRSIILASGPAMTR